MSKVIFCLCFWGFYAAYFSHLVFNISWHYLDMPVKFQWIHLLLTLFFSSSRLGIFPPWFFQDSLLISAFFKFYNLSWCWLLLLILMRVIFASWIEMPVPFPRLGEFSAIISSNKPSVLFYLSYPPGTLVIWMLSCFKESFSSLSLCSWSNTFHFLFLASLFSLVISSISLIHSSASLIHIIIAFCQICIPVIALLLLFLFFCFVLVFCFFFCCCCCFVFALPFFLLPLLRDSLGSSMLFASPANNLMIVVLNSGSGT